MFNFIVILALFPWDIFKHLNHVFPFIKFDTRSMPINEIVHQSEQMALVLDILGLELAQEGFVDLSVLHEDGLV